MKEFGQDVNQFADEIQNAFLQQAGMRLTREEAQQMAVERMARDQRVRAMAWKLANPATSPTAPRAPVSPLSYPSSRSISPASSPGYLTPVSPLPSSRSASPASSLPSSRSVSPLPGPRFISPLPPTSPVSPGPNPSLARVIAKYEPLAPAGLPRAASPTRSVSPPPRLILSKPPGQSRVQALIGKFGR